MKPGLVATLLVASILVSVVATPVLVAGANAPRDPSEPETATTPSAPGFFLAGNSSLDPVSFHHSGDMQVFNWAQLNPANGVYDFTPIDQFIAGHYIASGPGQPGKKVGIALTTYNGRGGNGLQAMPEWMAGTGSFAGATTEQITNGNFERGDLTGWTANGQVQLDSSDPHGGEYSARLGPSGTAQLLQGVIRIPAVLFMGQITYWWQTSVTGAPDPGDRLVVEILDGSTVVREVQDTSAMSTQDWQKITLDISSHDNLWATLRFTLINDGDGNQTQVWIDDVSLLVQPKLPKYWSSQYLTSYRSFVQALGTAFRNDSRLEFVAVGVGMYGETAATDNVDDSAARAAGLDEATWIVTVNTITDMYVTAFSQAGSLRKVLLLPNAPFQYQPIERRDFSAYAASRNVGLSFNGLFSDWDYAETYPYAYAGSVWRLMDYDPILEYGSTVPTGFEAYNHMLGDNTSPGTGIADSFYWGVLNALDKRVTYFRMSGYPGWYLGPNGEPVAAYTDIMEWAKPYFGASFNPGQGRLTPSVWVALRDHMTPLCYYNNPADCSTSSYWPPLGNFEFGLYQNDSVPAGRTVPQTYIDLIATPFGVLPPAMGLCPAGSPGPTGYPCYSSVYNSQLPHVREAQFIRRTDQATGNPFMFLDMDDQYAVFEEGLAEITVTYWDHGNDQLRLQYDSTSGPRYATPVGSPTPWVQKTGSNLFRQASFRVFDAAFTNNLAGNTDLAIDSRDDTGADDGNEWIHMVDVKPLSVLDVYDVNGDQFIDVLDIAQTAGHWLETDPSSLGIYDFNHTGVVDVGDVMAVARHWQG